MNITDRNLIAEIEALCQPLLASPAALFTPQQQNDVQNVDDRMLMLENLDEQIDQEQNRPNQRAFWNFDNALNEWDQHGRSGVFPHMPQYVKIDSALWLKWWAEFTQTKTLGSATFGDTSPAHYYLVAVPPAAAPVIAAAPLPPRIDPTASPVGASMGAGYFAALPGAAFLPDGDVLPEPRSYTGSVRLVKSPPSPFYPNGLSYFVAA